MVVCAIGIWCEVIATEKSVDFVEKTYIKFVVTVGQQ